MNKNTQVQPRKLNLLAFDSSTEFISIAVSNRFKDTLEHNSSGALQASKILLPAILNLLKQINLALQDLDAIVFGCGPGSFTGLRVACATAQGLAFGGRINKEIPLVPVDTLLATAEYARFMCSALNPNNELEGNLMQDQFPLNFIVALDARMHEVYCANWRYKDEIWTCTQPTSLCSPENIRLPAKPEKWTLVGNAASSYEHRIKISPNIFAIPHATALLRLAPDLISKGFAVSASKALPQYIRNNVASAQNKSSCIK